MKSFLSLMLLGSAVVLAAPAFADPKPPATEAECNKTEGYALGFGDRQVRARVAWRLVVTLGSLMERRARGPPLCV